MDRDNKQAFEVAFVEMQMGHNSDNTRLDVILEYVRELEAENRFLADTVRQVRNLVI